MALPAEPPTEPGEFITSQRLRHQQPPHPFLPQREFEPRYGTAEQLRAEWCLLKMQRIAGVYYSYQLDMRRPFRTLSTTVHTLGTAASEICGGRVPLVQLALIAKEPTAGLTAPAPHARLHGARAIRAAHEAQVTLYKRLLAQVLRWAVRASGTPPDQQTAAPGRRE